MWVDEGNRWRAFIVPLALAVVFLIGLLIGAAIPDDGGEVKTTQDRAAAAEQRAATAEERASAANAAALSLKQELADARKRIAELEAAQKKAAQPKPTPKPSPKPTPSPEPPPPAPEPEPEQPGPVYYENCSAARAAGAAPLYQGDPGYRPGLDRDGDGVACES